MLFSQVREYGLIQIIKMLFFAHKVCIVSGQLIKHIRNHFRSAGGYQIIHVPGKIRVPHLCKGIGKPAHNQLLFF